MPERIVVKLGGSLFDWPGLRRRFPTWLGTLEPAQILLVSGGGDAANIVRNFDAQHQLGEERAHWLALRTMTLNAYLLAELVPSSSVVGTIAQIRSAWQSRRLALLDAHAFVEADEHQHGQATLPHTWDATSDSVAARVAWCVEADRLILLKSATMPTASWEEASRVGYVDPVFTSMVAEAPFETFAVNLRMVGVEP